MGVTVSIVSCATIYIIGAKLIKNLFFKKYQPINYTFFMIVVASKPRMALRHFLKCAQKHRVF